MPQLRGRGIIPFGALRQNLLAVGMDYLGFNMAADTAFITLERVSSAAAWDTEQGEVDVVNVTLLTMSDNYQQLFGVVQPGPAGMLAPLSVPGSSLCGCRRTQGCPAAIQPSAQLRVQPRSAWGRALCSCVACLTSRWAGAQLELSMEMSAQPLPAQQSGWDAASL